MTGLLWERLRAALAEHHDRPALGDPEGTLRYGELLSRVEKLRAGLGLDGWSGPDRARVALSAGNTAHYPVALLAVLAAGAVPFLFDPQWGETEISAAVRSCGIDLLVHDRPLPVGSAGPARALNGPLFLSEATGERDRPELLATTELCRYTTGSTGYPNCVEFAGTAVIGAATGWIDGTGLGPEDRILCFAGLANGLAFNTSLVPGLLAGSLLHLAGGLPSAGHVLRYVRQTGPTRLTGFPALYASLLRRTAPAPELAGIRVAISSGAPLPPDDARALRERYGLAVANYYGIAETGPLTFDREPDPARGLGAPLPGVRFRIPDGARAGEPGAIAVRSTSMGSRYLNAPGVLERRLDEDGFYATGDEGYLAAGLLHLAGRSGKLINVGGRKVDPTEVADVLRTVPGVTDALVLEVTRSDGDKALGALVEAPAGLAADAVRAHCRGLLAPYKVPERLAVVDRIPASSIGKPRLAAARALLEG
ncbi:class I adenylate-forming enzyme family protein [Kitasatospora sp. NPDC093806]|uniref:class I adenylate-forming enzyme family protein n=1 Tax=Kitasatospora sp. NPDC093806 TaxID=3155075 RepID=UPI0034397A32